MPPAVFYKTEGVYRQNNYNMKIITSPLMIYKLSLGRTSNGNGRSEKVWRSTPNNYHSTDAGYDLLAIYDNLMSHDLTLTGGHVTRRIELNAE